MWGGNVPCSNAIQGCIQKPLAVVCPSVVLFGVLLGPSLVVAEQIAEVQRLTTASSGEEEGQ